MSLRKGIEGIDRGGSVVRKGKERMDRRRVFSERKKETGVKKVLEDEEVKRNMRKKCSPSWKRGRENLRR